MRLKSIAMVLSSFLVPLVMLASLRCIPVPVPAPVPTPKNCMRAPCSVVYGAWGVCPASACESPPWATNGVGSCLPAGCAP